ncbi:hypothetical protein [Deinococcus indicus]|nr:hypothetical protein [Deinococcus indicus]
MATLVPSWPDLGALPTPLTAGEAHLLAFLERDLGPEWEVFA